MIDREYDLDRIVAEVIKRLRMSNDVLNPHDRCLGRNETEEGVRRFQGRLVTLASLETYWPSCRKLLVDRRAVVTPAVIDELRRRGIELEVRDNELTKTPGLASTSATPYCVAVASDSAAHAHFVEVLKQLKQPVEQVSAINNSAAIQKATAAAKADRPSVICTDLPAEAVCLANRSADVWAVMGWDVGAIETALRETPANVLVVDPSRHSKHVQRAILNTFFGGK